MGYRNSMFVQKHTGYGPKIQKTAAGFGAWTGLKPGQARPNSLPTQSQVFSLFSQVQRERLGSRRTILLEGREFLKRHTIFHSEPT